MKRIPVLLLYLILVIPWLSFAQYAPIEKFVILPAGSIIIADSGLVQESNKQIQTIRIRYIGIGFGYLYPQYAYDGQNPFFVGDFRMGTAFKMVECGALIAARRGVALNVFFSVLFNHRNICPYLGIAAGYHHIMHHNVYNYTLHERKAGAFEFTTNFGLRFFQARKVPINFNLAFTNCANDYRDKAVIWTAGLMIK